MTENERFINDIDIGQLIDTKGELSTIDYSDTVDFYELWEFLNKLNDENEYLKQQLKEFEDYVYSDEKILCYSCVNCTSKGIYEVECSEKGKVDVHSSCFAYWKNEVEKND